MRLLRFAEVKKRIPISRQTVWRMTRAGKFPQSYAIAGGRVRGWLESDIEKLIQDLLENGAAPCALPTPRRVKKSS
jgi:predicted DNA-binding transcriptional regulator AlpA